MDFVPIPDCDGYFINKNGEILSKKRNKEGKIMKQQKQKDGYIKIDFWIGKRKSYLVHRLLALTFIDNPNNHKMVDHINRIRDDNCLENLRWVNSCGNCQNRTIKKNNKTGHRYIHIAKQKQQGNIYLSFVVIITHNYNVHKKYFQTLEKAIVHRDKILKELNREIIQ